ncbi:hypothetical protein [Desulfitibacter alkalitolerans]|uniref:hypothetical protein n=1 Tax=Desulfitibacter alkalitolerans TaxID=264641 RepID=UPI00048992F4|nr:hypothetical protein [Desulfitibacter alkalitolerans]
MKKPILLITLILSLLFFSVLYFIFFNYSEGTDIDIKTYETDYKFTVEDIYGALTSSEVHLKPQSEINYQGHNLNNVTPRRYEVLDALLLVYEFEDNEALDKGLVEVQDVIFQDQEHIIKYKFFELNNILVIYIWSSLITPDHIADEQKTKIEKGLEKLTNTNRY